MSPCVLSWDSCYKPEPQTVKNQSYCLISPFLPHGLDIFETFLLKEPVIVFPFYHINLFINKSINKRTPM